MKRAVRVNRLRTLQGEIDSIRRELDVNRPGEVLYRDLLCADTDEEVLVIADGFGGATTSVVEGNYPIDFFTRYEKAFETEVAAIEAADELCEERVSPAEVLG